MSLKILDRLVNNKKLFFTLQFTWGLLMNIIGLLVFAVLIIFCKKKPKKFGDGYYIAVGDNWGGLELGIFFLIDNSESASTKYHEAGHGIQNAIWGPLFIFVIWIPSATRYWYRELKSRKGIKPTTSYYSIWFERQASEWGYIYYAN